MIEVKKLVKVLDDSKINFFSGVPDSVLKKFSNVINNKKNHFIAVNEGSAVAMGIGYHLSTKKNSLCILSKLWFRKCNKPSCFNCT